MPYTASSTTTTTVTSMPHRRVSLSKPTFVNNDAKEPAMDNVVPTPIPNIASMRLHLAPPTTSLRPVLKQRTHSAPSTPGYPKYVRFDQKLEQVRLFLKAQTPSAVKEDPILDLEEADLIALEYPNWPTKIQKAGEMISIESIVLAQDEKSLVGKCKVNNIAFNKQVTVRYTFNYWQDVSEAQAAYRESISPSGMDRFMFNLPLNDRMEKSTHETMYFCLKYTVNGTEYWDNNGGRNYQVELHRGPASATKSIDSDFVVPKAKFGTNKQASLSSSPTLDFPAKPSQKKQLGSRYDFSASLSAVTSGTKRQPRTFRPSPPNRIQSFPSYFSGSALDGPTHISQQPSIAYNTGYSTLRQEGFVTNKSVVSPQPVSNPIPIHARPAANSPSYYDLVNKYCFYGTDSPISRSPNSTPAIHC